jgi:hypothetical protein
MSDIPFTDIIQSAYGRAKKDLLAGELKISEIEDLCHAAHIYALNDLYHGTKGPEYALHYGKPIDQLYELFDTGELNVSDTYASFAFCYLKVYEIEGIIAEKSIKAQFEHEKNVKISGSKG